MTTAIQRVFRTDAVGTLAKPEKMENGWLKLDGRIARIGIQEYEDADGTTHNELRLPEEVFSPESMASFHMVPVTNQHPPVLLDDKNTGQYQRGQVGQEIRKLDDIWIGAPMLITDALTVRAVESGLLVELSNGYTCVLKAIAELAVDVRDALVAKWGAFKFLQTEIRGNHLALVDRARAGPEARVRLDSRGDALLASPQVESPPERQPMKSLRIDGRDFELNENNASAIEVAIRDMFARVDGARVAAETLATQTGSKLKIVKDNATRLVRKIKRVRAIADATKAKMMACDECQGTGKVPSMDDETKTMPCDMCDGTGSFRMHMPIAKATGIEEGAADDDVTEGLGDPDEDMDETELETQQQTEEEAGAANKVKGDKARKDRIKEATAFQMKRDASLQRRIDRAVRARAALEGKARRFTGDADLSKMDSAGIMKAVITVLSPKAKFDGKTAADIKATFDALVEAAGEPMTASDGVRALFTPFTVQPRVDSTQTEKEDGSHLSGYDRMRFIQDQQARQGQVAK